jgi:hypothetical protein
MIKRILRDERGQSAVIMAMIMLAILAIFALVIDVGNAYAERRKAQNAADAAALAGVQKLSETTTTNRAVRSAIVEYAMRNGMPQDGVKKMAYTNPDGVVLMDIPDTSSRPPDQAVGVYVEVYKEFATYFARVLRWDTLPAAADSNAFVCYGATQSSGLFPIALTKDAFKDSNGIPVYGQDYNIWDGKLESPGNFGWVNWSDRGTVEPAYYSGQPPQQNTSQTNLANNMHNPERSGLWNIGEWLDGTTGNMFNSNKVVDELTMRKNGTLPSSVIIAIYDQLDGTGATNKYKIYGFARFRITDFGSPQGTQDWYVKGRFEQWSTATANTGGPKLGSRSACFPQPNPSKAIVGDIKMRVPMLKDWETTTTEFPMDIVLVMDKSGSMGDSYGGGKTKIAAAKDALKGFLDRTNPDPCPTDPATGLTCTPATCPDTCRWLVDPAKNSDKVGFVYYPVTYNGSSFRAACTNNRSSTYYEGSVRNELTGDKSAIKSQINGMGADGWTPIAGAMNKATTTLQNGWRDESLKFIILASDGMANVPLTGQPTEVDDARYGPYWPYPACNQASANDAIAEAVRATNDPNLPNPEERGAGAVVFTIAIGQGGSSPNFNTTLLNYMASQKPGSNERYFYNANNPDELDQAYKDIQREIEEIKKGCSVSYRNDLAAGATVKLKKNGATVKAVTADQAGSYVLGGVEPGTYTVEVEYNRDGIIYDKVVDQLGGAELTPEQMAARYTVTVPDTEVQETLGPVDFYLQSSQAPACP